MRELFPTVTGGCDDLGAESSLPYVRSVQAAMQEVTEAMREIEEARRAEQHLPPQSRLSWLYSMTFDSIGSAFLRGIPCCPALELSSAEYRVALRHVLHAGQPLLGQVGGCPDCGGEGTSYSPNHCPDATVLDAEGPGRHVIFDVATARPMADAHLGAAMMAPGAAARNGPSSTQHGLSSDGAGAAGRMASQLLESMEEELAGASPEQAMSLAEEGVADLMVAGRRVARLLEGGGMEGTGGEDGDAERGVDGRRSLAVGAQGQTEAMRSIILMAVGKLP
ncbi:hypothetical protein CYMTET_8485 [Cymbomonas tetramitiformis]|uniref:Uncharacterized protein n=1 Tax=Cymbomonas tetramitiformis TaxID=36881 RepID=A0AAE0LGG1_9CHLO|nr:hypothetical protein CYMTET_8485 [Cymbomonas tetramitiformis]